MNDIHGKIAIWYSTIFMNDTIQRGCEQEREMRNVLMKTMQIKNPSCSL